MKYIEFNKSLISILLKESQVVGILSEDGLGDAQKDKFLSTLTQELKNKLGDNFTGSNIQSALKDEEFLKHVLTQAGLNPAIVKSMPSPTLPTDTATKSTVKPPKSSTTKPPKSATISKSDTTSSKPIDPTKVTSALKHLNRELSGPETYKNVLSDIASQSRELINNSKHADVLNLLKGKLEQINKQIAKLEGGNTVTETTSSSTTSTGSIANIASPMMGVIKRMPPGQSFFAPTIIQTGKKTSKKAKMHKKR